MFIYNCIKGDLCLATKENEDEESNLNGILRISWHSS